MVINLPDLFNDLTFEPMIKKTSILSIFLFAFINLNAQVFKPNNEKLYQSLIGDVYIFTLFVDTDEDSWEEEEIEYYYNQLLESEKWLVNQASNYDQQLNFENDYFTDNKEHIYLNDIRRGQSPKSTIHKALAELGYRNFDNFLDMANFDFEQKKLKMVFFVKKQDRSHAYNYFSNKDLDLAIVYCKSTYGMITNHHVVSHEILHQFGAWDLYYGKSQTVESATKAKELYPNSVMINTKRNRENLEVDELTAWRVGWNFKYKKEYAQFNPAANKERKSEEIKTREAEESDGFSIKFDLKRKKN